MHIKPGSEILHQGDTWTIHRIALIHTGQCLCQLHNGVQENIFLPLSTVTTGAIHADRTNSTL